MGRRPHKPFAQRLRARRLARGLTQEQLAERVDVTHATISRLESSTNNPTYDMLMALAAVLECSPGMLLGEDLDAEVADLWARIPAAMKPQALKTLASFVSDETPGAAAFVRLESRRGVAQPRRDNDCTRDERTPFAHIFTFGVQALGAFGGRLRARASAAAFSLALLVSPASARERAVYVEAPAQPAASALLFLAEQFDLEFLFPASALDGVMSAPLRGVYTPEQALAEALRCTPFEGRVEDGVMRLRRRAPALMDAAACGVAMS